MYVGWREAEEKKEKRREKEEGEERGGSPGSDRRGREGCFWRGGGRILTLS